MTEIRRVEAQGSPGSSDSLKVFKVEVWTEEFRYHFSFEDDFYSAYRDRKNSEDLETRETVEEGCEANLENLDVQKAANFCIDQVEKFEED